MSKIKKKSHLKKKVTKSALKNLLLTNLAKEYYYTKNPKIKERIVQEDQGFVIKIAKNLSEILNDLPLDDLIGDGDLGLLDAIEKYNPELFNNHFNTYAINRIRGAMIDGVRARDELPLSIRKKLKVLNEFQEKYIKENHNDPNFSEYREYSIKQGFSKKIFGRIYELMNFSMKSLNDLTNVEKDKNLVPFLDSIEDKKSPNPFEQASYNELVKHFKQDLTKNLKKYRQAFESYLLEGKTMRESVKNAKISESRFSQICSKILRLHPENYFHKTMRHLNGRKRI